jgi:23S rRNA (adenine1618-N6)-methyltransferase
MHPRNKHQGRYDFAALVAACPELGAFLRPNPHAPGEMTIDFADARAVVMLNRALLAEQYGVSGWTLPAGYLCPPIPGRADYVHLLADLLDGDGARSRGPEVSVLDIGVGANGVYPLVGHASYGWRFVGADIDARALAALRRVLDANPAKAAAVELRQQADASRCLAGIWGRGEVFDATLCNPPFHASADEARSGSARKWRNLGRPNGRSQASRRNFGGQSNELWCEGGERVFVLRLVRESARHGRQCRWFTSLVSKADNLPPVEAAIRAAGARECVVRAMAQGQKSSRVVAWSYLDREGRRALGNRVADRSGE